jgi:GNAT superfamily N-acetyltransferase
MNDPESPKRPREISIAQESAFDDDGRRCVSAYFAELAARFEDGFDVAAAMATLPDDFAAPDGVFLVARLDGAAVGCGGLCRIDAEIVEMKRVWVSADARGRGLATALLAALEGEARARGFRRLRLDTNKALTEAQAMYVKAGFHDIVRYNDNPYAHRWFEKAL